MELARTAPISNCGRRRSRGEGFQFYTRMNPRGGGMRRSVISMGNSRDFMRTEALIGTVMKGGAVEGESAVAERPKSGAIKVLAGQPAPFGATACDGGVNFAICSTGSTAATLCLFTLSDLGEDKVTEEIPLNPLINRTGDIWHIFLEGKFEDVLYGYKFDGKFCPEEGHYFDHSRVLLDPYAKAVISRGEYGVLGPGGNCWPQMAGMIPLLDDETTHHFIKFRVSLQPAHRINLC